MLCVELGETDIDCFNTLNEQIAMIAARSSMRLGLTDGFDGGQFLIRIALGNLVELVALRCDLHLHLADLCSSDVALAIFHLA